MMTLPGPAIRRYFSGKQWLFFALVVGACLYALLFAFLGQGLRSHSAWDSYTLQTRSWLAGRMDLGQDYSFLELAKFDGKVFVSFPPVPSIILIPLALIFSDRTPSNLLVALYGLASLVAAYALGRRLRITDFRAAFWAFFLVFGSNLLECTVNGGVWYQAQALSFLFCLLALFFMESGKRLAIAPALACLALAVGCRPLQLVYLPLFFPSLAALLKPEPGKPEAGRLRRTVRDVLIGVGPFALIGILLGLYNFLRFGNPLEFGHRYLPEYNKDGIPVFSASYILPNLRNILRIPALASGLKFDLPRFNGMAFWLANPFFISLGGALALVAWKAFRRREGIRYFDIALVACLFIHALLLLAHNTLGGWQFGLRYFIDLLPFAAWYVFKRRPLPSKADYFLALWAIPLQAWGTLWLFLNWK